MGLAGRPILRYPPTHFILLSAIRMDETGLVQALGISRLCVRAGCEPKPSFQHTGQAAEEAAPDTAYHIFELLNKNGFI